MIAVAQAGIHTTRRQAGPLPASLVDKVRAVPGVANAEGQIQALGAIVVNGKFVGRRGAPTLVLSSLAQAVQHAHPDRRPLPQGRGQIAVDT